MTDQLDILALVTSRLDAAGIAYMVTGSMAAGYYGQPRMTRDVDLVVEFHQGDPERLEAMFSQAFLLSADTIRTAMSRGTMCNAIHREALVKVDFVIRKSEPFRIEEFARRRRVEVDGHPMWIVSPEDLVLSKLAWARDTRSDVQVRDVRAVIAAQRVRLDWEYVERWAGVLGIGADLEAVRA
jgi:hypothetical protein